MPIQTAHDLFLHELSDMLDAERKVLEALEIQASEGQNEKLQQTFQQHREQTVGQIERLEQCFEELGEEPQETECAGIMGLIQEHDNMKEEDPSDDIMDIFNATAAMKVEHYEITGYESLIRMADMMEHTKVSRLLKQTLKEEEQTLKKMMALSTKLEPENMGMDEEGEEEDVEISVEEDVDSTSGRNSVGRKPSRGRKAA
jgi:ferritin-like metal-binding protein YciE